jgi:hypothetical protein
VADAVDPIERGIRYRLMILVLVALPYAVGTAAWLILALTKHEVTAAVFAAVIMGFSFTLTSVLQAFRIGRHRQEHNSDKG